MKVYKNKKKDDECSNAEYLSLYDIVRLAIRETYSDISVLQITEISTNASKITYSSTKRYAISINIKAVRFDLMELQGQEFLKRIKSYMGKDTYTLTVNLLPYNDIYLTFKK